MRIYTTDLSNRETSSEHREIMTSTSDLPPPYAIMTEVSEATSSDPSRTSLSTLLYPRTAQARSAYEISPQPLTAPQLNERLPTSPTSPSTAQQDEPAPPSSPPSPPLIVIHPAPEPISPTSYTPHPAPFPSSLPPQPQPVHNDNFISRLLDFCPIAW